MEKATSPTERINKLRADLQKGMDDIAAGRTKPFDAEDIIKRGQELLKQRKTR